MPERQTILLKMQPSSVVPFVMVILVIQTAAHEPELDEEWTEFKLGFGKSYETLEEEEEKRTTWEDNLKFVKDHNEQADQGLHTYWLGVNEFSDMTAEEFTEMYAMKLSMFDAQPPTAGEMFEPSENFSVPDHANWAEKKNIVTRVKHQGMCGSCWAFATTGTLEGMTAIKTGKLVSLSEQNLVDCISPNACKGMWMDQAFAHIRRNGGINAEKSYPYEGRYKKCRFNSNAVAASLKSWKYIPVGDEKALQQAVAKEGPISFAMICCSREYMMYRNGIYEGDDCMRVRGAHAMLIVGYGSGGVAGQGDWWLIKNSWGNEWGDGGYSYMRRNKNICKMADFAMYPVL